MTVSYTHLYSEQIIKRLKANIASKIPTVVIDASTDPGSGALAGALVDSELPLTMLLGYSSWNTVGNAIGIAVSQGVARLNYLKFSSEVTQASNEAFIKTMTFAYIKDITYIIEKNRYLNQMCIRDSLYIGVDDSTPNINIQTNDINYIKSLMGDNATLFAGTDELGMLSMARLVGDLYGQQVNACVRYFGGGADLAADGFDIETLRENLTKHLTSCLLYTSRCV